MYVMIVATDPPSNPVHLFSAGTGDHHIHHQPTTTTTTTHHHANRTVTVTQTNVGGGGGIILSPQPQLTGKVR